MADGWWASLHTHSTFSYLDGYAMPDAHVARAAELGMNSLALTEHGNVSSHARLEQACDKAGIKPIYGLEAYTAPGDFIADKIKPRWHLGLLAMDQVGYSNLMEMVTQSWGEDFYYEATISGRSLADHSDGIAVLSGCTGSKLACDLVGGKGREDHAPDLRAAEETAGQFRDLFGDRYFLEVQAFPDLDKTRAINPCYEFLARRLGIPLIATRDVHYPYPDNNAMQVLLHATGRGGVTTDRQEQTWEYDVRLTYPETRDELFMSLYKTGLSPDAAQEAIDNTLELAERCNVRLPKAPPLKFPATEEDWNPWT
jgi:DNA polymerase-3 subunit alpha